MVKSLEVEKRILNFIIFWFFLPFGLSSLAVVSGVRRHLKISAGIINVLILIFSLSFHSFFLNVTFPSLFPGSPLLNFSFLGIVNCLYKNEVGIKDWYVQQLGHVVSWQFDYLDGFSSALNKNKNKNSKEGEVMNELGKKEEERRRGRIFVGTNQGVIALMGVNSGIIFWRRVLNEGDSVNRLALAKRNLILAFVHSETSKSNYVNDLYYNLKLLLNGRNNTHSAPNSSYNNSSKYIPKERDVSPAFYSLNPPSPFNFPSSSFNFLPKMSLYAFDKSDGQIVWLLDGNELPLLDFTLIHTNEPENLGGKGGSGKVQPLEGKTNEYVATLMKESVQLRRVDTGDIIWSYNLYDHQVNASDTTLVTECFRLISDNFNSKEEKSESLFILCKSKLENDSLCFLNLDIRSAYKINEFCTKKFDNVDFTSLNKSKEEKLENTSDPKKLQEKLVKQISFFDPDMHIRINRGCISVISPNISLNSNDDETIYILNLKDFVEKLKIKQKTHIAKKIDVLKASLRNSKQNTSNDSNKDLQVRKMFFTLNSENLKNDKYALFSLTNGFDSSLIITVYSDSINIRHIFKGFWTFGEIFDFDKNANSWKLSKSILAASGRKRKAEFLSLDLESFELSKFFIVDNYEFNERGAIEIAIGWSSLSEWNSVMSVSEDSSLSMYFFHTNFCTSINECTYTTENEEEKVLKGLVSWIREEGLAFVRKSMHFLIPNELLAFEKLKEPREKSTFLFSFFFQTLKEEINFLFKILKDFVIWWTLEIIKIIKNNFFPSAEQNTNIKELAGADGLRYLSFTSPMEKIKLLYSELNNLQIKESKGANDDQVDSFDSYSREMTMMRIAEIESILKIVKAKKSANRFAWQNLIVLTNCFNKLYILHASTKTIIWSRNVGSLIISNRSAFPKCTNFLQSNNFIGTAATNGADESIFFIPKKNFTSNLSEIQNNISTSRFQQKNENFKIEEEVLHTEMQKPSGIRSLNFDAKNNLVVSYVQPLNLESEFFWLDILQGFEIHREKITHLYPSFIISLFSSFKHLHFRFRSSRSSSVNNSASLIDSFILADKYLKRAIIIAPRVNSMDESLIEELRATGILNDIYLHDVNRKTNCIEGFTLKLFNVKDYMQCRPSIFFEKTWRIDFEASGLTIAGVSTPLHSEFGHVPVHVNSDATILYKFIEQNLIVVLTQSDINNSEKSRFDNKDSSSRDIELYIMLNVINTVNGHIICSEVLPSGAAPPIHMAIVENVIVVFYWNVLNQRNELHVIELFDAEEDNGAWNILFSKNRHHIATLSSFDLFDPPTVYNRTFSFPQSIRTLGFTSTRKGVTPRSLLLALGNSGQILTLSHRLSVARRPILFENLNKISSKISDAEKEEGIIPYQPSLSIRPHDILSYFHQVNHVRGICTYPSKLESTSNFLAFGLDMFYSEVQPAKGYDVLSSSFNLDLLIISMTLIIVAVGVTAWKANTANIQSKWL